MEFCILKNNSKFVLRSILTADTNLHHGIQNKGENRESFDSDSIASQYECFAAISPDFFLINYSISMRSLKNNCKEGNNSTLPATSDSGNESNPLHLNINDYLQEDRETLLNQLRDTFEFSNQMFDFIVNNDLFPDFLEEQKRKEGFNNG